MLVIWASAQKQFFLSISADMVKQALKGMETDRNELRDWVGNEDGECDGDGDLGDDGDGDAIKSLPVLYCN